jgi:hypothetical protein
MFAAFVSLYFYMLISRKQLYFLVNVILPAVFITVMAITSFNLPPDSGEKVSMGMFAKL